MKTDRRLGDLPTRLQGAMRIGPDSLQASWVQFRRGTRRNYGYLPANYLVLTLFQATYPGQAISEHFYK